MVSNELIRAQLAKTLERTDFPELGEKYVGKVRDCYSKDGRRTIVVTDRISAFDVVLGTIPFKGQVLNQIAAYWFESTRQIASNHVLSVPDPTVTVAAECELLPVEFVMRAYLTGVTTTSIWYHYENGGRLFCGHKLPEGMRKNQKLDKAILTPSTKAAKGGHDQSVSRAEILAAGTLSADDFDRAGEMCARIFAFGQSLAAQRGLILVDTKYEIGRRVDGSLCFIDEVHTPDSSRYWYADDYQARFERGDEPRGLDKEYLRRVLADQGYRGDGPPPPLSDEVRCEAARRYIALYELVTGRGFVPDFEEPAGRIRRNLGIK
ncbi:MAG TPA: phosphoribosylaminoimidazolesuccinocarboxamide synthase [Polyangia bacterium]|jgi:Phosphoribosylaminoimidazolesuccinocarboxamide (SAICAR) synthase|nr:phosphoribosylaminoimidazolesuccinocarboxamide synthase [Polyangia bacterium]